ncbi:basic proline-rich protein-like [Pectinophora gossypiella]|uniref:basic proline-rich protein-like n=1 Tax=Pectinophora gossypiella TaxID=13191 RepID=UPI00214E0510|nr:basic proline-rich protein-like [Pectinophora gossypiella]
MSHVTTRSMVAAEKLRQAQSHLKDAEELNERLLKERYELEYQNKQLKAKNDSLNDKIKTFRTTCDDQQLELTRLQDVIESFSSLQGELDLKNDRIRCLQEQLREAHDELSDLHSQRDSLQQSNSMSLHQEIDDFTDGARLSLLPTKPLAAGAAGGGGRRGRRRARSQRPGPEAPAPSPPAARSPSPTAAPHPATHQSAPAPTECREPPSRPPPSPPLPLSPALPPALPPAPRPAPRRRRQQRQPSYLKN